VQRPLRGLPRPHAEELTASVMAPAIRTNAAAAMLGVSPNTLRSWERRFGFPVPERTAGGHRQFDLAQIEALRAAFEETRNISSAVSVARQRGAGPSSSARLRSALVRYDEDEANRLLEESLALRSIERTLEEVLLPALGALGEGSIEHGFGWRLATGWMAAIRRLAQPASRPDGVLVFDASAPLHTEALHAQALELILRRGGLRTLLLSATADAAHLAPAVAALQPRAVVLAGPGASLDALGRIVHTARRVVGDRVAVFDFRGAIPHDGLSIVHTLPPELLPAREAVLEAVERRASSSRFVRAAER